MGNSSKVKKSDNKGESYKIVLIGDYSVGKSSIILKYMNGEPPTDKLLTFFDKTIKINNKAIKFQIWDTVGQERFHALSNIFYKNTDIIILCYDITSKSSFQNLKDYWYNEVKNSTKNNPSK